MSITPASTDLAQLVSEIVAMHRPVANQKEVRLELLDPVPVPAIVDPSRVMQALSNLVDNAVNFTPAGGAVQVQVQNMGGSARITVSDSGPGISAEHLPLIFERFWRSDQNHAGGLGLGLAIARGIATAHGGDIEVSSEPGRGSDFSLMLPLHRQGDPDGVSDAPTVRE
jgi:two-component system sensor histidine kinase BaeS